MKPSVSHLEAIGLAVAGFTLFVLADISIKIAGRSLLPAHEIVAFQGFSRLPSSSSMDSCGVMSGTYGRSVQGVWWCDRAWTYATTSAS
jgi:hypothetical protein